MNRSRAFLPCALSWAAFAAPLAAQGPVSRSTDYLFATGVDDARAAWVNPAGLGARPMASIFGEVLTQRAVGGGWRVGQYSLGLSSRNAAFVYRRDRFESAPSLGAWRVAGAFNFPRVSFGTSLEFVSGGRSWDVGLQYRPGPVVQLGFLVRNIGRPVVRDTQQLVSGAAGLGWRVGRGLLFSGEFVATERRAATGYDNLLRAGVELALPFRSPVTVLSAFEFPSPGSSIRLSRWSIGLAYGGMSQFVGVATAQHPSGATGQLESWSLAAVSKGVMRQSRR
jgi:hypothetical protein